MIQALKIEFFKCKRTKTFLILFMLILIASLWQMMIIQKYLTYKSIDKVAIFFTSENVDNLLLPIIMSIFSLKLISNEKVGNTFKLQQANGIKISKLFNQKITIMLFSLFLFFSLEAASRYFLASFYNITLPLQISIIFVAGQLLTSFILMNLFLALSFFLKKTGILLSLGFLIGFLGILLYKETSSIWSFWLPGTGTSYLAPYKPHIDFIQNTQTFLFDNTLGIRFVIYTLFAFISYYVAYLLIKKKGDHLQ